MFSEEFYPTPTSVAFKMLGKLSGDVRNILEPSAGKGDLAAILKGNDHDYSRRKVDCIESDPELAQILLGKDFPVVGFDWLTYDGVCYYDAIVMNPPFSEGDDHLLRAWDFLHSGEIVCLLNEETIKNPHTAARQRVAKLIEEHGSVEYLGDCFKRAQRATGVNVAMVYLKKVSDDDRVEVWATATDEKPVDDDINAPENMLAVPDQLGNMQHYYDMANQHMLKAFQHVRKASLYMEANKIGESGYRDRESNYEQILGMALKNINSARAEFGRKHRRDAWYEVFSKMQFHKWLDKKQREELLRDVEKNGNIPFTADNIKGTLENIILQRKRLFEQSVANVFDELVRHYDGNGASQGWKTNDNYKVNEKLVFPYGCHFDPADYSGRFELRHYGSASIDIYNDLDRVMAVLDGSKFEEVLTIGTALEHAFKVLGGHVKAPFNNTCHSTYFDIKFWKKGTVHLKFKDQELWAKFNQTAAAGKLWLGANTNGKSEWPGRKPEYAHAGGSR